MEEKPKLIVLIGAPCTGKTIWAKYCVQHDVNTIRVAREEIALMLRGTLNMSTQKDKIVDRVYETALIAGINAGFNVIADSYNTSHKDLQHYFEVFEGYATLYAKVFRADVDVVNGRVLERSKTRGTNLDKYVVTRMDIQSHVSNVSYITGFLAMKESPFILLEDFVESESRHPI